jgi:DNA-binding transcriptional regulator LsrR (DeoR family)
MAVAMFREGKRFKEIAQALEVTQTQARRYVRNAREQARKGA